MSDIAIQIQNIGKCYRLGTTVGFETIRDSITHAVGAPLRALRRGGDNGNTAAPADKNFWALRHVSFDVRKGDVVGIIGRNGAGKSTLLKILSRITSPTEGSAQIRGRVGSLLEVGTGFHPELSGRENIYLNGAILGMRRSEIESKFDEIVAFSEIEKFIDTPVKRYSSGMYTRLAFSVAAHLEPEVLIVDEVLAVGDAAFQKKCIGKMGEVAEHGRTVLFVSHNMAAVQALCNRGVFLRGGTVDTVGTTAEAVTAYLKSVEQSALDDLSQRSERAGRGDIRITRIEVSGGEGLPQGHLVTGRPARFTFHLSGVKPGVHCSFNIYDNLGIALVGFHSKIHGDQDAQAEPGSNQIVCELDETLLVPGHYYLNVSLSADGKVQDHVEGAAAFDVEGGTVRGRAIAESTKLSKVCLPHRWIVP